MPKLSKEALKFVTDEVLTVHELCDRANVPRDIEGELLSMSQRVAILGQGFRRLVVYFNSKPQYR